MKIQKFHRIISTIIDLLMVINTPLIAYAQTQPKHPRPQSPQRPLPHHPQFHLRPRQPNPPPHRTTNLPPPPPPAQPPSPIS